MSFKMCPPSILYHLLRSAKPVILNPFGETLLDPIRIYAGHFSLQMLDVYRQRKNFGKGFLKSGVTENFRDRFG